MHEEGRKTKYNAKKHNEIFIRTVDTGQVDLVDSRQQIWLKINIRSKNIKSKNLIN